MNIAILLAGGTGSRIGTDTPKQYIEVNGQMIITYALTTLCTTSVIDKVYIVADKQWRDGIQSGLNNALGGMNQYSLKEKDDYFNKVVSFVDPGSTRQLSIVNALRAIRDTESEECLKNAAVMIHDAARPNITGIMIEAYFEILGTHDGVMPVLPMKDTVYYSADGLTVTGNLDRKTIYAGQAPELFRFGKYLEACEDLMPVTITTINGSTEPAILYGMDILMTMGDEKNYKITTSRDLERFKKGQEG